MLIKKEKKPKMNDLEAMISFIPETQRILDEEAISSNQTDILPLNSGDQEENLQQQNAKSLRRPVKGTILARRKKPTPNQMLINLLLVILFFPNLKTN